MLQVGLGQAEGFDTRRLVERAIDDCRRQLEDHTPQAGIVFAGPHLDHGLMLALINETFPGIQLIGCTTSGNFSSFHGVSDDAITLVLLSSNQIHFGAGVGRDLSSDYRAAVEEAIVSATASLSEKPTLCMTFPNGYSVPFEPVLELLDTRLGPDCPVFGGLAGILLSEPTDFLQFYGTEILKTGLPILLMSGPVEFRYAIANSWRPIGKKAVVAHSDDRTVYRIGELSAVDYYRHYLGYHEEPAREFILAVYEPGSTDYFISSPINYNDDGSITFTGPISEGSEVQLTEAIREDLIKDTLATSKILRENVTEWEPALALNFSCGYRKTVLGTSVEKELEALKDSYPPGLPIAGFFSFGEIAPLSPGGPSIVQGATLITLLLGPRSGSLQQWDDATSADMTFTESDPSLSYKFLERRLLRSEAYRQRLESLNEFATRMHRQMIVEVEEARRQIQEKEEQLRESEEKFRRIVQTAGEGFVLMDESLTVIDANDAFCTLVSTQPGEVLNKSGLEFVLPEERSLFSAKFDELDPDQYQRFEGTLVARNGRQVPVLINSNMVHNEAGELIGHMAFFADLTEQKKALALAGEVQKSLLPQGDPEVAGLDIAGRNVSCDEVGGDYYDFFLQQDSPRHAFSAAVGDITGHGVDAALLMSSARAFLRLHVSQSESISEVVRAMNQHLVDDVLETGRFMTLFYLSVHADLASCEWIRAGHDPAILFDPATGEAEDLKGIGVALGIDPDYPFEPNRRTGLKNGNIIAIGTDGIWETSNSRGEMFGRERFKTLLRDHHHLPATAILNLVFEELETFRAGQKAEDDITLVIIKVKNK